MSSLDNIERLFLLEILVDNVYISRSELALNPRILSSLKQTVVRFQFLNYPPLEICEEDFAPSKGKYDEEEISFKSGKSCLFALRGQRPAALSPPFNMDVIVCRLFENNKSCTIGRTCIKLGECFATIITCCIVCPTSPTYENY
uniref:Uncharacterized protein n=1 Tax=Triatoma infestans TaxID=30076 RepID=A0A161MMK8_TRIIF